MLQLVQVLNDIMHALLSSCCDLDSKGSSCQQCPEKGVVCSVQMQRLVQACQPGDSLVFQFSGHGSQVRDYSGDEVDGLNETLLPCDFRAVRTAFTVSLATDAVPLVCDSLASIGKHSSLSLQVLCTRQRHVVDRLAASLVLCCLVCCLCAYTRLRAQAGQLTDDEVNRILVNPLPHGVRLHAIIDACHSGSVCPLGPMLSLFSNHFNHPACTDLPTTWQAMDLEFRCKVKYDGPRWKQEYLWRPRHYKVGCSPRMTLSPQVTRAQPACLWTHLSSLAVSAGHLGRPSHPVRCFKRL